MGRMLKQFLFIFRKIEFYELFHSLTIDDGRNADTYIADTIITGDQGGDRQNGILIPNDRPGNFYQSHGNGIVGGAF